MFARGGFSGRQRFLTAGHAGRLWAFTQVMGIHASECKVLITEQLRFRTGSLNQGSLNKELSVSITTGHGQPGSLIKAAQDRSYCFNWRVEADRPHCSGWLEAGA